MKAKTFTESQIVRILKDLDSGKFAADVARENSNSYVLSPGVNTVYIYNGNGVQATFPLKNFRTIGNK